MKGKPKQKSKKPKGNAVLQKYMVAVGEFIKSKADAEDGEHDRGLRFVKKKSRKELRKEKRKMKKAKMKSHYEGKKSTSSPEQVGGKPSSPADKRQLKKKKTEEAKKDLSQVRSSKSREDPGNESNSKSSTKTPTKKVNRLQESRKRALLEANEDEDREIKRLERCLGFNKRKNKKNLPQSFMADGLDYILGMLDSGVSAAAVYDGDDDMDTAKEKFQKLGEDESQLPDDEDNSDDDDDDEMSGDEGSLEENDLEEESDEDELEEEEGAEMEDEEPEDNAATSDEGSEADEEDANASDAKSDAVGSEILDYCCGCSVLSPDLIVTFPRPGGFWSRKIRSPSPANQRRRQTESCASEAKEEC